MADPQLPENVRLAMAEIKEAKGVSEVHYNRLVFRLGRCYLCWHSPLSEDQGSYEIRVVMPNRTDAWTQVCVDTEACLYRAAVKT